MPKKKKCRVKIRARKIIFWQFNRRNPGSSCSFLLCATRQPFYFNNRGRLLADISPRRLSAC